MQTVYVESSIRINWILKHFGESSYFYKEWVNKNILSAHSEILLSDEGIIKKLQRVKIKKNACI